MIDEKKILKGLRKACAKGWRVYTSRGIVDYNNECGCALSVAAVGLGWSPETYMEAGAVLGMTSSEISDFIRSFDTGLAGCAFARRLRHNCISGNTGEVIS